MIRKLATVTEPVAWVQEVFCDVSAWPQWMPSTESVEVVREEADRRIVDVVQLHFGRRFRQRAEVSIAGHRLHHTQISGPFRRWRAIWSFLRAPDGRGTTLALELDLSLGTLGILSPQRMVQARLDRWFADTARLAEERARQLRQAQEPEDAQPEVERLLQIFETDDGLELWLEGRRYALEPIDR